MVHRHQNDRRINSLSGAFRVGLWWQKAVQPMVAMATRRPARLRSVTRGLAISTKRVPSSKKTGAEYPMGHIHGRSCSSGPLAGNTSREFLTLATAWVSTNRSHTEDSRWAKLSFSNLGWAFFSITQTLPCPCLCLSHAISN